MCLCRSFGPIINIGPYMYEIRIIFIPRKNIHIIKRIAVNLEASYDYVFIFCVSVKYSFLYSNNYAALPAERWRWKKIVEDILRRVKSISKNK